LFKKNISLNIYNNWLISINDQFQTYIIYILQTNFMCIYWDGTYNMYDWKTLTNIKLIYVCMYTCSMLPSSISVLNVSNMDSWSRFSKSSIRIGAVINTNLHKTKKKQMRHDEGWINEINKKMKSRKLDHKTITIGFGEPRE